MNNENNLKEIAKLFLKLGIIGFGGPTAHIAMIQREVVLKKKWLSQEYFLDLLGGNKFNPWPK